MRKSALIAATAAASFSVAAVAHAIDVNQGLDIKTTGVKGTATKLSPLKLDVTTSTNAKDPSKDGTFATKRAVIFFDKNLKFNNRKFPTCTLATVASKPERCPAGSKVGAGFARATVGPGQLKVNPTVVAYNAANNKINLKLVKKAGEVDSSGVLVGTLKSATGIYGSKLDVPIPAKLQNQLGLAITLTKFNTVISNKKIKGFAYANSRGCNSNGKYNFKGTFTYSDGTSATAKDTSLC